MTAFDLLKNTIDAHEISQGVEECVILRDFEYLSADEFSDFVESIKRTLEDYKDFDSATIIDRINGLIGGVE